MLIYSFTFFEHGPHVLFLLSCLLLPTILFHAMQHYTTVYTRQLNGRESPVAQWLSNEKQPRQFLSLSVASFVVFFF